MLLPAQYINVLRIILIIISNYFPIQHPQIRLAKQKGNSLVCEAITKSSRAVYSIVYVCEGIVCCLDMSVTHTRRLC